MKHPSRNALLCMAMLVARDAGPAKRPRTQSADPVSKRETAALLQSITDEIYTRGYGGEYATVPSVSRDHRLLVLVNPHKVNGMIWSLYELQPRGEVLRGAYWSADKHTMLLAGGYCNVSDHNGEALLTVSINPDTLATWKRDWARQWTTMIEGPDSLTLRHARQRQAVRDSLKGGSC